jgi:peptidoglycan/LPS O-acetylase OafA/YrhL
LNQGKQNSHAVAEAPLIRSYMPELDSVRGLAIFLVLLLHGTAVPLESQLSGFGNVFFNFARHGGVGVNLFFVLSGFLITGILIDSKHNPDYFRRFYVRRALRILPAFYAVLLVLLISGWLTWRFATLSVLFLANVAPLLGMPLEYGPLWSLAVEEHFYLAWPAIVHKLSSRVLALAAMFGVVTAPLLREAAFLTGHYAGTASLYTWFNLDGLAMGALLAIWLRQESFRRRQLSGVALLMLVMGVAAYTSVLRHPSLDAAFLMTSRDVGCAGWLSCMLLLGTGRWRFLADVPILRFLGFISYGLYLIHVPIFKIAEAIFSREFTALVSSGYATSAMLLRLLAGSTIGIAIAYLSRRFLEEKFLRMGVASSIKKDTTSMDPGARSC